MDLTRILNDLDNQIAALKRTRADVAAMIAEQTGTNPKAGDTFLTGYTDTRTDAERDWTLPTHKPGGKIDVIKMVREVTSLGLREAKEGVERACPSIPFPLGYLNVDQIARLRSVGCDVLVRE